MNARHEHEQLLQFNVQVLDQGLAVISAYEAAPHRDFAAHAGPHLRHIIEHYEAFTQHLASRSVDYDSRQRDCTVQCEPVLARARIEAIQHALLQCGTWPLAEPIAVHQRGGLAGEQNFVSFSTIARELLFLASHATHHYALIQVHSKACGIDLGADFGKAPATVHHARTSA